MDDQMKSRLAEGRTWIREELNRCMNFWLENGIDPVNGGVYTCLDREGKVFSTDKSVWMQGRCGWIFSWLCHLYGVREEWLQAAQNRTRTARNGIILFIIYSTPRLHRLA